MPWGSFDYIVHGYNVDISHTYPGSHWLIHPIHARRLIRRAELVKYWREHDGFTYKECGRRLGIAVATARQIYERYKRYQQFRKDHVVALDW